LRQARNAAVNGKFLTLSAQRRWKTEEQDENEPSGLFSHDELGWRV
jgi:hypothetical protein